MIKSAWGIMHLVDVEIIPILSILLVIIVLFRTQDIRKTACLLIALSLTSLIYFTIFSLPDPELLQTLKDGLKK